MSVSGLFFPASYSLTEGNTEDFTDLSGYGHLGDFVCINQEMHNLERVVNVEYNGSIDSKMTTLRHASSDREMLFDFYCDITTPYSSIVSDTLVLDMLVGTIINPVN